MQFLYFIPGVPVVSEKTLKDTGLIDVISHNYEHRTISANGPDGLSGVIFWTQPQGSADLLYKPDKQSWIKSNNGRFYLGYYKDSRPSEQELGRERQIDGHKVTLSDGSQWLVPMARVFPRGTKLPGSLILGPDDEVYTEPLEKYVEFSNLAEDLWHDISVRLKFVDGTETMSIADELKLAHKALNINYHIGADEINLLRLMTTENQQDVELAVVDGPSFFNWLKKKTTGSARRDMTIRMYKSSRLQDYYPTYGEYEIVTRW